MITLLKQGHYKLIDTKHNTKILYLDNDTFAWVNSPFGELLVESHKVHKTDSVLCIGHYRIYTVENEPELADLQHLELETGLKSWQGYLLLSGLPSDDKPKVRIIPTIETIAGNPHYRR